MRIIRLPVLYVVLLLSCNLRKSSNCGVNFKSFAIDSCSSGSLRVEKKLNINKKPVLLSFFYNEKLIRKDTVVYDGKDFCVLNKEAFYNDPDSFFIVYSHIRGFTYGFVYYKLQGKYHLGCLIKNQNHAQLKLLFANKTGQKNLFSFDSISRLKILLSGHNFYDECVYLKYNYVHDSLQYQIKEDNIKWSASTPWLRAASKTQNIYIDHETQFRDMIKYYTAYEAKQYR